MAATASPLTHLAEQLLEQAKALDAYNAAKGLPPASFDNETFVELPLEIETQRRAVINMAQDLKRLAQGPRDLLFDLWNVMHSGDLANFHFIYHYNIPKLVPAEGTTTYGEVAAAIGVDEVLVRRMLRVAMINRLFVETPEGRLGHSASSRILHREPAGMDAGGFFIEEMFPAATKMVEAMEKYPGSGESNETGFNLAFNTSRPFYRELQATPERASRFGSAMRWFTAGGSYSVDHLIKGYDWASFDNENGVLVDVGGGHGAISIALARATKRMRFIVQDLPVVTNQAAKAVPPGLQDRVSVMAHDFFTPQPIKGASVYFLRTILHNWSDGKAERILGALVPALVDGSRIVIYEFLPSDVATTAWTDKQPLNMDMIQAIGFNSIERTASDWAHLFQLVDKRLEFLGTRTSPGSNMSIIEAKFHA